MPLLVSDWMPFQKQRDPEFAQLLAESEAAVESQKAAGKKVASSRRGRKSEKQEDAELLADAGDKEGEDAKSDEETFVFTESPACKCTLSSCTGFAAGMMLDSQLSREVPCETTKFRASIG